MNLDQLKTNYLAKTITKQAINKLLPEFSDILDDLFPLSATLLAKFHLYVNELPVSTAICERSGIVRRFKGMESGFMQYCGNQGVCICNRENIQKSYQDRTSEQKQQINNKRSETNQEKYGDEFASRNAAVKKKAMDTCLKKYGSISPMQNSTVKLHSQTTCQSNWGVLFPQQNPVIMEKSNNTNILNLGVCRPAQNSTVLEKTKGIFTEKYGVDNPAKLEANRIKAQQNNREFSYQSIIDKVNDVIMMFTKQDYLINGRDHEYAWKCKKCNTLFQQSIPRSLDIRCLICRPIQESWGETLIKNWLADNNIEFTQRDRTIISPLEVDFWIPAHNIAIEFNGIYWHSEDKVSSRNYHQIKWKSANDKGIKLLQIWEHDLHAHPEIIFHRLHHAFGLHSLKIAARKCIVKQLLHKESKQFFDTNHLQGHRATKHVWGLFLEDKLVAAASFGKSRYNKKTEWELLRYATSYGVNVQGGLGKLLSYAQKQLNITTLISYANLNWGSGDIYGKLGFELQGISNPNYWYWKNVTDVKSRLAFQKHKIVGLAPGNSEKEIAKNLGYNRFFDAGNAVWIKTY